MKILFSIFSFIVASTGFAAIGIMLYRQSAIKKLKGEKTQSVFYKIKDFFSYIKKHIKLINFNFTENRFYNNINQLLKIINFENKIDKQEFLFIQQIFLVVFFVLSLLLFNDFTLSLILCVFGFYLPFLILKAKVNKKQQEIVKELPDAIDVIAANIEGGLSINQAIYKYANTNKNLFAEELQLVLKKIKLGKSFEEVMHELDEKFTIKEITSFVNSFIQAEKTGGNIKKIIKDQAEEIRKKRFQYLKKKAYEAPVKLLIPLILFIFPVIFIVIFGPIIIKMLNGL
jgi:tight adherence protein C